MPKDFTLETTAPKVGRTITTNTPIGETLNENVEMFGEEAVRTNMEANFRVYIQGVARRMMEKGKTDEEIIEVVKNLKMGVSLPRAGADPVAAIKAQLPKMTDEQKKALLAELRKAAA